ncbi:MAG: hypothetical protein OWR52_12285 [Acidibacillus sp.]|uniref:Uncharacterized protein n=1 Tax=Sulfoacidibacillus ferrooxidans TaxID=2005001 RepID=A0A9X2AFD5_9BACL|nr:hypothetical protein [Sulfoacidibacillus ferrooxidans]MCI0184317.1 hypothetical protein [Sulfoacidibacillus ferrooxidans]MCY0894262.1 hypothetical protein [Acidibacillus sp.]
MHYALVTEHSRKSRAAKNVFDFMRTKSEIQQTTIDAIDEGPALSGFHVPVVDRARVVSLRFHDEHLSPYFKTNMNLFHLLMIDEETDVSVFKTEDGVLFVFEGIPENPLRAGQSGHDMR